LKLKSPIDERGISVILAAALVIAIFITAISAFLVIWAPGEMGRREHEHMQSVEGSLLGLKTMIEGLEVGQSGTIYLNMSANPIPIIPFPNVAGTLSVLPTDMRTVVICPSDDAYVVENSPTKNFEPENLLLAASKGGNNNSRAFLKFSLKNIPIDVSIYKAELWLYCGDYKFPMMGVTDVQCRSVGNDNWLENEVTWGNQPNQENVLDSLYVDGIGWVSLMVKDFVAHEVTGDRIVSLGLRAELENYDNTERYVGFYSKEGGDKKPYLKVMYTMGPPFWMQTDWSGGSTLTPESNKWPANYNSYYNSENENTKMTGEIRLDNEILAGDNLWSQTTKENFEANIDNKNSDNIVILDRCLDGKPGIQLENTRYTFGTTVIIPSDVYPYNNFTYVQTDDPHGEHENRYDAPYNGVIIQWSWYPGRATNGAKFKIFRYINGTNWTCVGESGPKNLGSGMNTFSDYIPVKAGDRIGMYSGDTGDDQNRTYWSAVDNYSASRTRGDINIQGTSSFTEHTLSRRLPIEAILEYYPYYLGTFTSSVFDTKSFDTSWRTISWKENLPPGTDITFETRTGMDNNPYLDDGSPDEENWSRWSSPYTHNAGETIISPTARYIQYRATFSTNDTALTPILHSVNISYIPSTAYKPSGQLESSVYDAGSPLVHWENIIWDAETPSLSRVNENVGNEPNPMVDWSPLIGENLSPVGYAQAQDNIYENIAEENRPSWWNWSWACRRLVTIKNENNRALENYQVEIKVTHYDNMLSNFDDLRFVDNDNVTELSYWIENYVENVSATVWVKVPKIPENGSKEIYMYYGNPGASPGSDFSATFPRALIIDGIAMELGGRLENDWVEIKNGGILGVKSGEILELFARKIIVRENSYIYATGSGYSGGPTNRQHELQENGRSYDNRPGTGGGRGGYALGTSDGPGGGGGAYGGAGGKGGGARGDNDYPGDNGSTFGSENDNSVYMGSGGGSGGLSILSPQNNPWNAGGAGGAGGGAVILNAGIIEIFGTVSADGGAGASGMCGENMSPYRGNGGGGGGSGGTILIEGNKIVVTGTLTAKGGKGGARSQFDPNPRSYIWPYGGAGGGGGGGRIKVFYDENFDNTDMTYSCAGGASGGPSYDDPVAENGENGSYYAKNFPHPEPTTSVSENEEQQLTAGGPQGYYLNWEHRITGVRMGYENYIFHIWGYSGNENENIGVDDENIGVYIWSSKTNSWVFENNLPKSPGDSISFIIPRENLSDYLISDSLSIGYLDNAGDNTRTVIHIDYCALECEGEFSTDLKVYTRTGSTENAYDGSWSGWQEATDNEKVPSPDNRYLQYRVDLFADRFRKLSPVFKEITVNFIGGPEYGTIGFESRNLFYPSQTYVYEGGAVILVQDGVDIMISKPTMIAVSDAENNNIRVDVNFLMVENKNEMTSLNSTGIGTIEAYCKSSTYAVTPVSGPNRENITLIVTSSYRNAWGEYLRDMSEELKAMGIGADFDPNMLTLTIKGRYDTPGVKDIYYYEKFTEIEITFR
jgi:hypothetical protein